MRATILAIISVLIASVAGAQVSVTQRFDFSESGKPQYSTYLQGLPVGLEVWSFSETSAVPMNRIGLVRKVQTGLKAGCYLTIQGAKVWANPKVALSGDFFGGKGIVVLDAYAPMSQKANYQLGLSESNWVFPVTRQLSVGPGLNGSWVEGKGVKFFGALTARAQLNPSTTLFLRANLVGPAPRSLRCELIRRF
jgi:hypothetical protein